MWKYYSSIIKELTQFSTPLIINQFCHSLTTIIFARITGHISTDALVITNLVDLLIYSLLGIFGSGTLAFNIHSSKIKKTDKLLFNNFFRSIIELNFTLGVLSLLIICLSTPFILTNIFHLSGNLLSQANCYTFIVSYKLIFSMLIFAFSNQLKIYKKTNIILLIGVCSNLFQLVSVYIFTSYLFNNNNQLIGLSLCSTLVISFVDT